jgi:uncharacterized membrane protein
MDITPTSSAPTGIDAQAHHVHKNLLEGIHFKFPTFKHDHPAVIDVNKVADERLTMGQKIADGVAATIGSWRFIIIQSIVLTLWILLNSLAFTFHWDNYPYVLCNLALSFEAAFSAPFIMMSQNRQAEKDRIMAESDYHTNVKGEEETRNLMDHLDHQDMVLLQLVKRIEEQHEEVLHHLARLDPELARRLGIDVQEVSKELVEEDAGNDNITGNS